MAPDPHSYRCSYQLQYEPDSSVALDGEVLARIRYGRDLLLQSDPREIDIALQPLGAEPLVEVWRSRLPVEHGRIDGVGYAHNGDVLFGHLHLQASEIDDLGRVTSDAYLRIERLLRQLGYPCWLRTWNFLAHINDGAGDAERYRQFSQGRHHALALQPDFAAHLPAATAIGMREGGMRLHFLAARNPGEQIENPRQLSAFRYPADYGPQSPSFSRATLKHWADGIHLFVSGTASIVGHQSLHPDDPLAQLDETFRNLEALLAQAALHQPLAAPFHAAGLKIFLRHGEHRALLLPRVQQLFGAQVPLLWLNGDICRRELLLEIEGLYTAAPLSMSVPVSS